MYEAMAASMWVTEVITGSMLTVTLKDNAPYTNNLVKISATSGAITVRDEFNERRNRAPVKGTMPVLSTTMWVGTQEGIENMPVIR